MTTPSDDIWTRLSAADVRPFPLATETNYTADGWQVALIVPVEITGGGHGAVTLMIYEAPYSRDEQGKALATPDEAERVTREAVTEFAHRLRRLLEREP